MNYNDIIKKTIENYDGSDSWTDSLEDFLEAMKPDQSKKGEYERQDWTEDYI